MKTWEVWTDYRNPHKVKAETAREAVTLFYKPYKLVALCYLSGEFIYKYLPNEQAEKWTEISAKEVK